ncbi:hypothetical protein D3C86_1767400 [compost metagenome]
MAVRHCTVDACAVEVAAAQHGGEQAHLAAGAGSFALNAAGGQGGFPAYQGNERIVQCLEFGGDGVEERGAAGSREMAKDREGSGCRFGGRIHFSRSRLVETIGQRFAGVGVVALQGVRALGRAAACDVVVA